MSLLNGLSERLGRCDGLVQSRVDELSDDVGTGARAANGDAPGDVCLNRRLHRRPLPEVDVIVLSAPRDENGVGVLNNWYYRRVLGRVQGTGTARDFERRDRVGAAELGDIGVITRVFRGRKHQEITLSPHSADHPRKRLTDVRAPSLKCDPALDRRRDVRRIAFAGVHPPVRGIGVVSGGLRPSFERVHDGDGLPESVSG